MQRILLFSQSHKILESCENISHINIICLFVSTPMRSPYLSSILIPNLLVALVTSVDNMIVLLCQNEEKYMYILA